MSFSHSTSREAWALGLKQVTPFCQQAASVNTQLPKYPDPSFHDLTNTGQYSLEDGRIVIVYATTEIIPLRHRSYHIPKGSRLGRNQRRRR